MKKTSEKSRGKAGSTDPRIRQAAPTDRIPQHEIVTLAVFLLGGHERVIDTEDIAMRAAALAPGRFSWRKYPEQINLELVRVFLSDAKKAEFGRLISGSGSRGWTLTVEGLSWARARGAELAASDLRVPRQEKRSSAFGEVRWRTERARLLSTPAWQRWSATDPELLPREAAEVFRIDSYATPQSRDLKINRLMSLFDEDSEIRPFLTKAASILRRG